MPGPETKEFKIAKPKALQHEVLQKFKDKAENAVPTLDQALFRAAASGTPEDIDALLFYGAKINAQDEEKRYTPLHNAMLHKQAINAKFLLQRNASRNIADKEGKLPTFYARNNGKELVNLFPDTSPVALQARDLLTHTFSFLTVSDLQKIECVSYGWKLSKNEIFKRLLTQHEFNAQNIDKFEKLPSFLKAIIIKWLLEKKEVEKIKILFDVLNLPSDERLKFIFPDNHQTRKVESEQYIISDTGLVLSILGILPEKLYSKQRYFCNEFGALILLLNLDFSKILENSSSTFNDFTFGELISKNGYLALKENLITIEIAFKISELKNLLSDVGLQMLREKLISSQTLTHITSNAFPSLFSELGMKALQEKLISFTEYKDNDQGKVREIGFKLTVVLTQFGLEALKEGLIRQSHLENSKLSAYTLKFIFSEKGLRLLRTKLFTVEQLMDASDLETFFSDTHLEALQKGYLLPQQSLLIKDLKTVLSNETFEAIKSGLINIKEIINAFYSNSNTDSNLIYLLTKNGLTALKNGYLTIEQAAKIHDLRSLLSDNGLLALKDKIISADEAMKRLDLYILNLSNGARALSKGWITFEQAAEVQFHGLIRVLLSEPGLSALEEKLITFEQATRFYPYWSAPGAQNNLQNLLSPTGLAALREGIIKVEDCIDGIGLNKIFSMSDTQPNPYILAALRYKLISPKDFKYGSRFSLEGNDLFLDRIKKMVKDYEQQIKHDFESKTNVKSIVTLQNRWRGLFARKKLVLFKELGLAMKQGDVSSINKLADAKLQIEQGKLSTAKTLIDTIKLTTTRSEEKTINGKLIKLLFHYDAHKISEVQIQKLILLFKAWSICKNPCVKPKFNYKNGQFIMALEGICLNDKENFKRELKEEAAKTIHQMNLRDIYLIKIISMRNGAIKTIFIKPPEAKANSSSVENDILEKDLVTTLLPSQTR